jgi:signal transduction histidine kinase
MTNPPALGRRKLSSAWVEASLLALPLLLVVLIAVAFGGQLRTWLSPREQYDEEAIVEWIKEARVSDQSLPDLTAEYLTAGSQPNPDLFLIADRRTNLEEMLEALGSPPTKMYGGQLPLFPIIYKLEVQFRGDKLPETLAKPVVWQSGLPTREGQYRTLMEPITSDGAGWVVVHYSLHTYQKLQQEELAKAEQQKWAMILAAIGLAPAVVWVWVARRRERERERQQVLAQRKVDEAKNLLLEEELRRQEAELGREAAERQALELRSQMFASIGIMAGSYAHNIKNLLVRPNDLLSRCLEGDGLASTQKQMLNEVHQTLGTVTERLQQILRTVRRDPTRAEMAQLDLNWVLTDLVQTWQALALDKWNMNLMVETSPGPLWVEADLSHLQQAVENLLFNARDATFEMRNHLRTLARTETGERRKQALIAAASWKGQVTLRCHHKERDPVLEVRDNGIGMTEDVRRRCLEPHFTTKRDNALYEGHSTGMGLGLAFVAVIVERHRAALEIESTPLQGTTFRLRFTSESPAHNGG